MSNVSPELGYGCPRIAAPTSLLKQQILSLRYSILFGGERKKSPARRLLLRGGGGIGVGGEDYSQTYGSKKYSLMLSLRV